MNGKLEMEPYRRRKTWSLGSRQVGDWRLKTYGIVVAGTRIDDAMIAAAFGAVARQIAVTLAQGSGHGFVILHRGDQGVWLLIDRWAGDILHHVLLRAPLDEPAAYAPGPEDGTMACVWEMAVMQHERDAWVRHVLSQPAAPDFAAYLADQLEIDLT